MLRNRSTPVPNRWHAEPVWGVKGQPYPAVATGSQSLDWQRAGQARDCRASLRAKAWDKMICVTVPFLGLQSMLA
jgi:hypothetical protein